MTTIPRSSIGPEHYKRTVTRFLTGFPDLRFSIEDVVAEEEKLAVSWNFSGTHKGKYMGISALTRKCRSMESRSTTS